MRASQNAHSLDGASLESHQCTRRMSAKSFDTIIAGAGIVGSAVAAYLSESLSPPGILVVDRSIDRLAGSTGYAPGLIGQLNVSPILTTLAQDSVEEYEKLGSEAYQNVGCLELADSDQAMAEQNNRFALAAQHGIKSLKLEHTSTLAMLPPFVKRSSFRQALHFPDDGVADPPSLVRIYQARATSRGVHFVTGDIVEILHNGTRAHGIKTSDGHVYNAPRIILATGVWTASIVARDLRQHLPIIPVAHPYVFSTMRPRRPAEEPFIRWPEHHVYGRSHGSRDGFGTYNHVPVPVSEPGASATWDRSHDLMDEAIANALNTCVSPDEFDVAERTCSIFAVTPDNLPLVGPLDIDGVWVAAAVWITTAAGCAKILVRQLLGEAVSDEIRKALDPGRFRHQSPDNLQRSSLRKYNDIYDAGDRQNL